MVSRVVGGGVERSEVNNFLNGHAALFGVPQEPSCGT